jgi:hypothetical protein
MTKKKNERIKCMETAVENVNNKFFLLSFNKGTRRPSGVGGGKGGGKGFSS